MLNQTCTIRRKTSGVDSTTGGKTATWANSATGVACTIQPNSPREEQIAARETGVAGATIWVETTTDIRHIDQVFIDSGMFQFAGTAVTVLITRSGTTATVADTAHGLTVGLPIVISGADQSAYNGSVVVATVPDANSWTYTVTGSPATPATGTISRYAPCLFSVTGYPIDDSGRGTYLRAPVEYRIGGGFR